YYSDKKQTSQTCLAASVAFDDEEQTMPLLAAHLYAWLVSKERNENPLPTGHEVNRSLVKIHEVPPRRAEVTMDFVKRMIAEHGPVLDFRNDANANPKDETAQ